jgi:hypothetical protein
MENSFENSRLNQPNKESGQRGLDAANRWKQRMALALASIGLTTGQVLSNPVEALATQKTEQPQNQITDASKFQSSQNFPGQEFLAQAKAKEEFQVEIFSSDAEYKTLLPYVQKGANRMLFSIDGKTVTFFRGKEDLGTIQIGNLGFIRDKGLSELIIDGRIINIDQQLF